MPNISISKLEELLPVVCSKGQIRNGYVVYGFTFLPYTRTQNESDPSSFDYEFISTSVFDCG